MDIQGMLMGGLDVTAQIALTIGTLLLVGGLGFLLVYFMTWPHTVIVRVITSGEKGQRGKFIKKYSARTITKKGVTTWKLKLRPFKHKTITAPPAGAIHLTKGGKLFVECYMNEDDPEPRWLKDTGEIDESFDAFSTEERSLHVEAITRDLARRKKSTLEILMQLAPMIGIIILVLGFFIFFENIAKPAQDMMKANERLLAMNAEISAQNARMVSVLAGKLEVGELTIEQEFKAPPDAEPPTGETE